MAVIQMTNQEQIEVTQEPMAVVSLASRAKFPLIKVQARGAGGTEEIWINPDQIVSVK